MYRANEESVGDDFLGIDNGALEGHDEQASVIDPYRDTCEPRGSFTPGC